MTDTVHEGTPRTRRSLLTAAAGGAAALAASAIAPVGVAAGVVEPVIQDTDNATVALTSISASGGVDAFEANSTSDGTASAGNSVTGIGVRGQSSDGSDPVNNAAQAGVVGIAGGGADIATNFGLTGVYGFADQDPDNGVGAGVWGDSPDWGVVGTGSGGVLANGGWGVRALTGDGIGVYTSSDDLAGLGLLVDGRAAFSRSGRTTVGSGKAKKAVNLAGVTSSSLVFAVLAQSRSGRYVRAVVAEAGKFTVYLNRAVTSDTKVTWIVFTNPSNLGG